MERKYGFLNTGKGCLVSVAGWILLLTLIIYLEVKLKPSRFTVFTIVIIGAVLVSWISLMVDKKTYNK